jgi:hemolysin III
MKKEKNNIYQQYSLGEEIANSITHGIGIVFGIAALSVLMILAGLHGTNSHFISYLIYGISTILLYTCSTLYHAIPSIKAKKILKILDHSAIYLMIAGTYTPFLVLNIKGTWGLSLMIIIWSLTVLGIIFKIFFAGRFRLVSTLIYLAMGWLIFIATKPLVASLSSESLTWLIVGGLMYSLGTIFYLIKKIPYHHAIWHLFVLAGSVCHFVSIIYSANLLNI